MNEQRRVLEVSVCGVGGARLTTPEIRQLADHVNAVGSDDSVGAVLLVGDEHGFCTGRVATSGLTTAADIESDLAPVVRLYEALAGLPVPIVSAIDGAVHGMGVGLLAHSDLSVATPLATFSTPEITYGVPPLLVLEVVARKTTLGAALALVYGANVLTAHEALRIGLVSELTDSNSALTRARELAARVAEFDAQAIRVMRAFAGRMNRDQDISATQSLGEISALLASRIGSRP